ncbi:hypothetical protein Bbelb_132330 [Branchiostoma belcheri]|nr:hypothetical protein Bbelb_132330 [Branchiostoma belcheri]
MTSSAFSDSEFGPGYVCYVFSENVGKEWHRRTPLARHSHGFARCKSVVCTPRLAVGGCVHRTLRKCPAHAREIRRVLVASMDFRAPRVRPRIFPYTPGFVLAVHVHGNLRPAHLACVGERLTIRDDLKKLYRQAVGELRKERKKSDCSHTEEDQAGGKQADCTPRLRSKGEGAVLKAGRLRRPRPAPLHSRPGCTPRPARRSGLTAITTDTNTTPSRRQTWGSLSFQDENISLCGGSDFSGAGQRSPGSRKGGPRSGCSGVPRTGTAGPREWEQRVPGTGATGPESGAATHGAVHGHFLPCTGMYRDRVRAYNAQDTTCTQKVVHFRECTGHVRDWTRFVCRKGPARREFGLFFGTTVANGIWTETGGLPDGCRSTFSPERSPN